jgi:hypothetical protein
MYAKVSLETIMLMELCKCCVNSWLWLAFLFSLPVFQLQNQVLHFRSFKRPATEEILLHAKQLWMSSNESVRESQTCGLATTS